ncbi:MAG: hypothetical protein K0S74_105 [Chlamydiales bacterium]|jgi:hypothetical protein|nr:hypothetical protein [Chlamydiales bacterium]
MEERISFNRIFYNFLFKTLVIVWICYLAPNKGYPSSPVSTSSSITISLTILPKVAVEFLDQECHMILPIDGSIKNLPKIKFKVWNNTSCQMYVSSTNGGLQLDQTKIGYLIYYGSHICSAQSCYSQNIPLGEIIPHQKTQLEQSLQLNLIDTLNTQKIQPGEYKDLLTLTLQAKG